MDVPGEITQLLSKWHQGDEQALGELIGRVYQELRILATARLKSEDPNITLQPTVLIHEAYLRLVSSGKFEFENRTRFYGFAGEIMRHVVVDYARARLAGKRGSGKANLSLSDISGLPVREDLDIFTFLALDQAVTRLKEVDERLSEIVSLRFFAGLEVNETAEFLNVSPTTVKRGWRLAKHWLARELKKQAIEADPETE